MKIRTTMAAIGALLLFAAPALADPTLGIQLSEPGFGTVQLTGSANPLIFSGNFGTFTTNVEVNTVSTNPLVLDLGSTNISSTTPGTLTITASASGLHGPIGSVDFLSQFTGSFIGSGAILTDTTYLNLSNTLFATDTLLSLFVSSTSPLAFAAHDIASTIDPFSLTEVLTILTNGPVDIFSVDAQLSGVCVPGTPNCVFNPPSVPEPTSLAILGTALAGLGIMRWRRRRQSNA